MSGAVRDSVGFDVSFGSHHLCERREAFAWMCGISVDSREFGLDYALQLESLILAQSERWRQA